MMKKIITMIFCAAFVAALAFPVAAIELTPEGAATLKTDYAKAKGGSVRYGKQSTAYCPTVFNSILETYGLQFDPGMAGSVPASYAKVSGSNVRFGKSSIAYEPADYHAIFTAYGLQLSPEEVSAKLGAINYAKVKGGNVVFAKGSYAYSPDEMATILSAYSLPAPPPAPAPAPAPVAVQPADSDKDGVIDERDKCPGTPPGAVVDERGCWALSAALLFDFDKSTIKSQYASYLDDVAKVMNDNPNLRVEVQGHADSIGSNVYNQGLSERRATAVQNYLIKTGITPTRLSAVGFGEENPIASNSTEDGRAKNRRVEFRPIW